MRTKFGWLVGGFFGLVIAANAQTPPPAPIGAQFDGTYAFVSALKVTDTYRTTSGRMGQCGQIRRVGPLTIGNGQARYASGIGNMFNGTVGSGGQLAMRLAPRPGNKNNPGVEIGVNGSVDSDGTVTARQSGRFCVYDLVWRKQAK